MVGKRCRMAGRSGWSAGRSRCTARADPPRVQCRSDLKRHRRIGDHAGSDNALRSTRPRIRPVRIPPCPNNPRHSNRSTAGSLNNGCDHIDESSEHLFLPCSANARRACHPLEHRGVTPERKSHHPQYRADRRRQDPGNALSANMAGRRFSDECGRLVLYRAVAHGK